MVEAGYAGTELGDPGFLPSEPAALRAALAAVGLPVMAAFVPVALSRPEAHDEGVRRALHTARLLAAVAEAGGLPIWAQMFAFGSCVASTFAAHIACTIPNCTMPIDELPHIRVDDLSGGSMNLSDGAITLSDTPGLGISLDMEAVEKYRIR